MAASGAAGAGPVLGIDTSSRRGSVALLAADGATHLRPLEGDRDGSRRLLPAIEGLLAEAGCRPAELRGLAVAVGPGPFTGLRVGLSTAQGLGLALGRPCLGVDTFEAWDEHLGRPERLAIGLDALRGELLGAVFERGRLALGPFLASPEEFAERAPAGALLAGGGVELYAERLRARRPDLLPSPEAPYLALTLARLGGLALERGAAGAPGELRPRYLRAAYVPGA